MANLKGGSTVGGSPIETQNSVKIKVDKALSDAKTYTDNHIGTGGTAHAEATTNSAGFMSSGDKTKLNGVTTGATKVEDSTTNGNILINGIENVVYTHPSTHPATMITQDTSNRFVTDTEKATWNGKLDATAAATSANKLTTARTISLTGDVTGSVTFDGSANASITTTQKNSGVTVGTYKSVTVDAKGVVTAGTNPTTLSGFGITDAYTKTEQDDRYTRLSGFLTSNTGGTYSGQWTKIATVTITGQYSDAQAYINGIGYGSGSSSSRFKAFFRVKQQNALGAAPIVELYMFGQRYRTVPADLVAVNTTVTATQTVVDLFLKINTTYENFVIQSEQEAVASNATIDFLVTQGFVVTLPAGTQTISTSEDYDGNAATATKLATGRTISLTGDVTGSATFDGSANISISATVANDSHSHDGAYVNVGGDTMTGPLTLAVGSTNGILGKSSLPILVDHNNGNVTVSATGGALYLGYTNTTSITVQDKPINDISYLNGNYGTMMRSTDEWLRINDDGSHGSGVFFGGSTVRSDGAFEIGPSGADFRASAAGATVNGKEVVALDSIISNSNGIAIRWTDGTQICYISKYFASNGNPYYLATDVPFPAAFINTSVYGVATGYNNYSGYGRHNANSQFCCVLTDSTYRVGCEFPIVVPVGYSVYIYSHWIGRWK